MEEKQGKRKFDNRIPPKKWTQRRGGVRIDAISGTEVSNGRETGKTQV